LVSRQKGCLRGKEGFTMANANGMHMTVTDPFWSSRIETVRTQMIPYQWEALNDRLPDAEPSHCVHNYKVASGQEAGRFEGCVFQDSDLAKWIEAASYTLISHPDPTLQKTLADLIELIASAQQPDGYLDTYYIINGLDKRFTNLRDHHELYCAGHLIEAAVAHHEATGSRMLLDVARRLADCMERNFGAEPGKMRGYPGHEVLEMALVRLYNVTEEERYLHLARYFVEERGQAPLYFEEEEKKTGNHCHWSDGPLGLQYYQAGKPIREQTDAEGHAVRAVYYYSGVADVARLTGDESLLAACDRMWESITRRRMYITGGIGSSDYGEAFTYDYDLPNDTAYAETCAAIGLVFFARRMLAIRKRGEYADVIERALYNGILSGMSLDGQSFFYVNPLEVVPEACEKDQLRRHVQPERQKWFGCACCPPNLARLLASLDRYAYSTEENNVFVHLYLGGSLEAFPGGERVVLELSSGYPWNGEIRLRITERESSAPFTLALRIPGWCRNYTVSAGGEACPEKAQDGYLYLTRAWKAGDEICLSLSMPVERIKAHPAVRADIGKIALMRGPIVYCLEEADNGADLHHIRLGDSPLFQTRWDERTLGGITVITCEGKRLAKAGWEDGALYRPQAEEDYHTVPLRFIPYYAWANRGPGEMAVWIRQ
jgi:DUF1680 family protein